MHLRQYSLKERELPKVYFFILRMISLGLIRLKYFENLIGQPIVKYSKINNPDILLRPELGFFNESLILAQDERWRRG